MSTRNVVRVQKVFHFTGKWPGPYCLTKCLLFEHNHPHTQMQKVSLLHTTFPATWIAQCFVFHSGAREQDSKVTEEGLPSSQSTIQAPWGGGFWGGRTPHSGLCPHSRVSTSGHTVQPQPQPQERASPLPGATMAVPRLHPGPPQLPPC